METLDFTPELDEMKARFDEITLHYPERSDVLRRANEWEVEQLGRLLSGDPDLDWHYFLMTSFGPADFGSVTFESERKDVISDLLQFSEISVIEPEMVGEARVRVFKTNRHNIYALHSVLDKGALGSSEAWGLVRVDPGKEDQYLWLREGKNVASSVNR